MDKTLRRLQSGVGAPKFASGNPEEAMAMNSPANISSPVNKTSGATELAERIHAAQNIVTLTGAGISTECGIPDFRSKDRAWKRYPPMPFEDFIASEENRAETWRRKFAMDDLYKGAAPGRGHLALAQLLRCGKLSKIITQNIDGLHTAAGAPAADVIELHGNGTYAHCLACGKRFELPQLRQRFEATGAPPYCECGGMVKSAAISFGQPLPPHAMQKAAAAAKQCDLFLAIGTTLLVQPAAALPLAARQAGAELVILNREPTPCDRFASLILRDDIGSLLEAFLPPPAVIH